MNSRKMFLLGVTLALLCFAFSATQATAEDIKDQKDWEKGAAVVGVTNSGSCVFRPFVKVGDAEDYPDDGHSQILGYEPGNVVIKNGTIVWERIDEASFILLNRTKPVRGRLCKAPPYNE